MIKKIVTNLKLYIWDIISCLILGQAIVASNIYLERLKLDFSVGLFFKGIGFAVVFFILAIFIRFLMLKLDNAVNKFSKLYTGKFSLLIVTLIILLFWTPILVGMYPGTMINDSWGQLSQYYYQAFSDHHPIFDTIIIGFMILGLAKSTYIPNWHRAFFIFVIIQAILTAFSFAYTIYYSKKKLNINNKILTIVLLFYCILPVFPLAVQTISKDAIFSWIYVLFMVNFIEIVRTNRRNIKKFKRFFIYIFIIFFMFTY